MTLYRLLCLALMTSQHVYSFPSGPPVLVCASMNAVGHNPVYDDYGYAISSPPAVLQGSKVTVSITGSKAFRGLFLQVREGSNPIAVGDWDQPLTPGFQLISCTNRNNAVGHSNSNDKNTGVTFTWNPPDSCAGKTYTIRATVVQTFKKVQRNIFWSITCLAPPTGPPPPRSLPSVTDMGMPQVPGGSSTHMGGCMYGSFNQNLQGMYDTSFEPGEGFKSWNNVGGVKWAWQNGPTPSNYTGPPSAADGSYYIYIEASNPTQPGQMAVLESNDVRGCYCVMFYCHSYVSSDQKFMVMFGDEPKYVRSTVTSGIFANVMWMKRYVQIDSNLMKKIKFVAERGRNWRGDTAIDKIKIEPGMCKM